MYTRFQTERIRNFVLLLPVSINELVPEWIFQLVPNLLQKLKKTDYLVFYHYHYLSVLPCSVRYVRGFTVRTALNNQTSLAVYSY